MPRIHPVDPATATGETAVHLATARKLFGGTPNVFTTAGRSPSTLGIMVNFFAEVKKGTLGAQIGEQIAIAVAQSNRCGYCLSAHSAIGAMVGVSPAELAAARLGGSATPRIAAILKLAVAINAERGHVSDVALEEARRAGVTDAEVVEIVGHVALSVFTNYLNNISQTTIDFPVIGFATAA